MSQADINVKPPYDAELLELSAYVSEKKIESELAYETARLCLMDALGCAFLALSFPECTKLLGPLVPGTTVPLAVPVPGTAYQLDPVQAAFNIGTLVRWLDYNDTWLAQEWGHPSDNLGSLLSAATFQSLRRLEAGKKPWLMRDLLTAMIKAYEIQGVLALENAFNRLGLDHVVLVKIASSALGAYLLDGDREMITATLSQAWVDGQSLRTYRHAPNTGARKSWAAGDACARALWLALMTERGEKGYPSVLSAKTWGFQDSTLRGGNLKRSRPYGSYVMENILFKVAYPAEFHAQTAVEAAIRLNLQVKNRWDAIDKIELATQEPAVRIISKTGPLHNPADRDHCLQYMVAAALLQGDLKAEYYEDSFAKNPLLDELRAKMRVVEELAFSKDYLDPNKRSIANALQVFFKDGTATEKVVVEYPLGHQKRRQEALPLIKDKFRRNMAGQLDQDRVESLLALFEDVNGLDAMTVLEFMGLWSR